MALTLASKAMVLKLIKQSNPHLPVELTQDNVRLLNPTTIPTPIGSVVNTELTIAPKPRMGYAGKTKVKYRRTNLGTWFRSVSPVVELYTPAAPGNYAFKIHDLLPYLNRKYGMALEKEDVDDAWFPPGAYNVPGYIGQRTSTVVVKAAKNSLGFVGQFTLRWVAVKMRLNVLIPVTSTPERQFPGGNDFDANQTTRLNSQGFGVDWTPLFAEPIANPWGGNPLLDYLTAATPFGADREDILIAHNLFLDKLNQYTDSTYVINKDEGWEEVPNNLFDGRFEVVSLPSAKYPEANSLNFTKLIVFTPSAATSWSAGHFFLHHNTGL